MDLEKMKRWMELAKQFQQGQFWDNIFENEQAEEVMDQFTKPPNNNNNNLKSIKFPSADIFKNNREHILIIDLPGVRKEDVEISINDYSVQVKGVAVHVYSDMATVLSERYYGKFDRTFSLPEMVVSGDKISAKFVNGTLEIRIPRSRKTREKIIIE